MEDWESNSEYFGKHEKTCTNNHYTIWAYVLVWQEIAPDPNSPKQICLGLFEALICTLIFGKFAGRGPGAVPPGAEANLHKLALPNSAN